MRATGAASRTAIRTSGYVAHALEAGLWSFVAAGDFRSAVLRAANLGEDADTTAAITGRIAGAAHGAARLPADWRRRLAWSGRIEVKAAALLNQGSGSGSTSPSRMSS